MYRHVLNLPLDWLNNVTRAKKPSKLPVVLTREEVSAILLHLDGGKWIIASLLYGAGLRLMEAIRLRVKDIDCRYNQITIRNGKGNKDRVPMLPLSLKEPLYRHLSKVKALHEQDLKDGFGQVYLPYALQRQYSKADREWGWQYVLPTTKRSVDPRSDTLRRHHVSENAIQKAVTAAIR